MKRRLFLFASCFIPLALTAQTAPHFEVDPSWPKPLPEGWITGQIGGVCTDSHDHIVVVNRRDITAEEAETSQQAPPIIMFDLAGNVTASWGDPNVVPHSIHGCAFDPENNVWVGGNDDGIIQKYSHAGKLLLQIGTRGIFDTSDGTSKGKSQNASHERFFNPAGIAIDGSGSAWLTNFENGSNSITGLSNTGAAISGASGYTASGTLTKPFSLANDGSGNIWVGTTNGITELIGAATPVITPLSAGVKNNTLGTRP